MGLMSGHLLPPTRDEIAADNLLCVYGGSFGLRADGIPNGQTIRRIAWAADVRQDRTLSENGTAANRGRQKLRFQTLPIAELGTFRRLTLPEIPSSLLLMCPTYSLLDIRRSDSVLCRLAIVEF